MTQAFTIPTRCPYCFEYLDPATLQHTTPEGQSRNCARKELPYGWQGAGVITVAMAGARASGKSVYLAVMIELLSQFTNEVKGNWRPATSDTEAIYEEHFRTRLFEEGKALESTRRIGDNATYTREPLIFSMDRPLLMGQRSQQEIFLVFRDIAGEDLQDNDIAAVKDELAFLSSADLVVFLFDPLADEDIRLALAGLPGMTQPEDGARTDPAMVLRNVLAIIEAHRRPEQAPPRIAVTMSKFDVLQKLAATQGEPRNMDVIMRNRGAAFNREGAGMNRPWDQNDNDLLHQEIRSMLVTLDARGLFNQLESWLRQGNPEDFYRCFAVSALGFQTRDDEVDSSGIAPFRCLDPIRSLLAAYGIDVARV